MGTEDFFTLMKEKVKEELKDELRQMAHEILESEYHHKTIALKEAAAYIGVSEDTLRAEVREGKVPHFRVRGRILFRQKSLDKWMEEQEQQNCREQTGGLREVVNR